MFASFHMRVGSVVLRLVLCTLALFSAVLAQAQVPANGYPVSGFELTYGHATPALPDLASVSSLSVPLGGEGLLFDRADPARGAPRAVSLNAVPAGARFTEAGLQAVMQAIVAWFNARDIFGVFVVPQSEQIDPATKADYRPADQTRLTLVVWVGEVGKLRVVGKGSTLRPSLRDRILQESPLQARTADRAGSLLLRPALEEYLWRLNDQPGRRVEASLTSTQETGQVALDYLVNQSRPWTLLAQVSNTGTPATGRLRSRASFASNQATSHDDVLSLDYFTTTFNGSQAVFASYERPLIFPNWLKVRTFGSWGNFNAQPLGIAFEAFSGSNWSGGLEVASVLARPFGITTEVTAGTRWQHFSVISRTFHSTGDANLFLPYVGAGFRRVSETLQFSSNVQFEANVPEIAGTHRRALEDLGRLDVDAFWWTFRGNIACSVFLDALGGRSPSRRLHEVHVSLRGQYTPTAFRTLPQELEVVGGYFSIRGYPESVSAGDSAYAGTLEYRFHLPRALRPNPEPKRLFGQSFRFRPRRAGDDADWDLILRAFGDAGQTFNNRIRLEERNQTLVSAGVGLELIAGRHFNVRVDTAYAFRSVDTELEILAEKGSVRTHFIATVAW